MKTILLVIESSDERERIRAALGDRGLWVTAVDDRREAMRAAADQAPDLVLVSSEVAGAAEMVKSFGTRNGGPGALLLAPPDRTEEAFAIYEAGADRIMSVPVRGRDLIEAVEHALTAPRDVLAPIPVTTGRMFTAQEIFGDVLAEVERHGAAEPVDAASSLAARPAPRRDPEPAPQPTRAVPPPEPMPAPSSQAAAPPPSPTAGARPEAAAAPATAPAAPPPVPPGPPDPAEERPAVPGPGRFGQYELVERIAVGGMAEVWRARMSGVEGFQKTVAIKKILPHLAESGDFVTMFIDEAKLAAELSHENIVDIYDLGKIGGDYFIAMEYVEGRDLRSILNACRERGARLPLGLSLMIGARVASALDHAHRRPCGEGELGLVHRDVSPRNVLISREGHVKLCDFGVAKAASTVARTQVGVLKGKLEYMSPEQASGGVVDGRSDVFSLGSLLFEMVTGEPLFSGEGEVALLDAVRACRVRSARAIDPAIPREVERIVGRALRKDPAKRYPGAGEMQRELEAALRQPGPAPGAEDLAHFVGNLFAAPAVATGLPEESGTAVSRPAAPAPEVEAPPTELRNRRRWIAAGVAALVVIVLGITAAGFLRDGAPEASAAAAVATPEPAPEPEPEPASARVEEPAPAIDVETIVERELERREAELREAFLEEERRLQRELERLESEAGRQGGPPPP